MIYGWKHPAPHNLSSDELNQVLELLEKRRTELLNLLPFECDIVNSDVSKDIINEWLALLEERDQVTRLKAVKNSQHVYNLTLCTIQELIGKCNFQDDTHVSLSLKQALKTVQFEIRQHIVQVNLQPKSSCTDTKPCIAHGENEDFLINTLPLTTPSQFSSDFSKTPMDNISNSSTLRKVQFSSSFNTGSESSQVKNTSKNSFLVRSKRLSKHSPKRTPKLNDDLRKSIMKSKECLRKTPGVDKSPGGTPKRKKPKLDLRNAGDLVSYALRKKFQSVRRLYESPISPKMDESIADNSIG